MIPQLVNPETGDPLAIEEGAVLRDGNLLLEWALNLMVLNVSTRKYYRAVRLPEGDLAKARGDGTSKSAVSRRFVALSRKKMKAWLASDLSELDLLVIQIDGLHVGDHVLVAAIGVDGNGDKHVLAVVGELVGTSINKEAQPLLRYRTRDVLEITGQHRALPMRAHGLPLSDDRPSRRYGSRPRHQRLPNWHRPGSERPAPCRHRRVPGRSRPSSAV